MFRIFSRSIASAAMMAGVLAAAWSARPLHSAPLDARTFDDPFTMSGAGHLFTASGGMLTIGATSVSQVGMFALPGPGNNVAFSVSAQVGSNIATSSRDIGLQIGTNSVVFHPGTAGGLLRVDGAGGFGNQNVTFTPAANVLHTLTVSGNGAGLFNLSLQNGGNPAQIYTNSWTNAANTNPTVIGVRRGGQNAGGANGMFDNLSLSTNSSTVGTFSQDFAASMGTAGNTTLGTVSASGGQLRMTAPADSSASYTAPGQTGNLLVSGGVGAIISTGVSTAGMSVGGNTIAFQPGVAGGNLSVSGTGGFSAAAMGFTPASGALQNMEIAVDAATGRFTVAVADASNPGNVYAARFTNASYVGGAASPIGFQYSAGTTAAANTGVFDNLVITQLQASIDGNPDWVGAVQSSNPLHWFRLNETTSNIAIDSGSGAQHGVYQNGVVKGLAGATSGAAQFDGVNDQVSLGAANLSGTWTAEFVVSKQGLESVGSLLNGTGVSLRLDQYNNTGEVGYTASGVADYRLTPGLKITDADFHHLVFVGDPSEGIDVYLDGFLVGSNSAYIPLPRNLIGGGDTANMLLDELAIYNRAMSAEEIFAHALAADFAALPEPSTIIAWSIAGVAAIGFAGWRRRSGQA